MRRPWWTTLALTALLAGCGGSGPAANEGGPPAEVTSPAAPLVPPAVSTPPAGWTLHAKSAWSGGQLTFAVPAGQRAAVLLLNTDPATIGTIAAEIAVVGAIAPATVSSALALAEALGDLAPELAAAVGHERARAALPYPDAGAAAASAVRATPARQRVLATAAPGSRATFCVRAGVSGPASRRHATLRESTKSAFFYVDDADYVDHGDHLDDADLSHSDLTTFGKAWEEHIFPAVTATFGPPSDVDGNGKLTVLFTSKVGPPSGGGVVVGYFWSGDVVYPAADATAGCTGTASNHADMFTMNTPKNLMAAGFTRDAALETVLPGTLAHELQHLVNFNLHCLVLRGHCTAGTIEDTWLNEGLSKLAEDVAGYGWHSSRGSGAEYMKVAPAGGFTGYATASMTVWAGDPIGNYEGVHAFLRYLGDRHGDALLTRLAGDPVEGNARSGKDNLAAALGQGFEAAMADFATAALFSNEPAAPDSRFDYTGSDWTPFHEKVRRLEYVPLQPGAASPARLVPDGWNAFVTGVAGAEGATVTVQSASAVKPAVVSARFAGSWPSSP